MYSYSRFLRSLAIGFFVSFLAACGGGGGTTTTPPSPPPGNPVLPPATVTARQDIRQGIIYQIVTDRFFDGDISNNDPAQSAGLFDATHTDYSKYWGGDFAGIQQKIPYLKSMGVQTIWISPPADNVNSAASGAAPYHGFHARDFKGIEEHFGDSTNSWAAFDALITAAHANNIKIIVDFPPNHSNPRNSGEAGALFDNGAPFATYSADTNSVFHHTPTISDWNDRYQLQYYTLLDLADLDQENPAVDQYLKDAAKQFLAHGADGFRFDAVKHTNWGWQYSLTDTLSAAPFTNPLPPFMFGEWFQGLPVNEPLYPDSVKFANKSGMSLLDFPLSYAIRSTFAGTGSFRDIDALLTKENLDITSFGDLVTFFDSHDIPRLLSVSNNKTRFHQALTFLLTCRGVPVVYYGDEQYLHNDTNGGGDPYNRVWMSSFDTTSVAFNLVQRLAALRSNNNALAYGWMQQRWLNDDVYIYERSFRGDIVLVAINKNSTVDYNITGLLTSLPAGTYTDYFGGYFGGKSITVSAGTGSNPVTDFTLARNGMAIWQTTSNTPIANVALMAPSTVRTGSDFVLLGKNLGTTGTVKVGGADATIVSWSDTAIHATVPSVSAGPQPVSITGGGYNIGLWNINVRTAPLIPVRFTVQNVPTLAAGESLFLTGNVPELGSNTTTFKESVGPMLTQVLPVYFITASVPAGEDIQFKFFKLDANGNVTGQEGSMHFFTVPPSGVGSVAVNWQP